jgi:hypothetical protein
MSFTSIQMLVNEIHRLLRDHVGEIRVAEYCEACMTQDTNRLLYVGHAVDMGSVGDDTVSNRAAHDHAARYVMDDLHIVGDGDCPSIRVQAICKNVPPVLTRTTKDA